MFELLQYQFMKNALASAVLASILCGIIGTIIVEKKLVSMSGGIAHTTYGGIGLGFLLGIEPLIGGIGFALAAAFGISYIQRKTTTGSDTLVGMFWAVGMGLGVVFVAMTPGYPPDMTTYLFGDILTVSSGFVGIMIGWTLWTVLFTAALYPYLKAYLFDEEHAQILGFQTRNLEYLLYAMIALSIVFLIKVVGIVLAIALLTIPPATAKNFSFDLKKIMIYSILIGCMTSIGGMLLSYMYNIPSGATIILLSIVLYVAVFPLGKYFQRQRL
jgi:zinc transport system permease protein